MAHSGRRLTRTRSREETPMAQSLSQAQGRFLDHHTALNHSPKQLTHYRITFADFARFLEATRRKAVLETLTSENLQAFSSWLKAQPRRSYRGSTQRSMIGVHGHMKDLRAFVRWCADEERGLITWKVTVPMPKVPRRLFPILTEVELATLWRCPLLSGKSEGNIRNRAIFGLLLDTGIRLGEAGRLAPADVIAGSHIRVIGKGDKQRLAPFTHEVRQLLDDWAKVRAVLEPQPDDPLFLLTAHGIDQMIGRLARSTGIAVHPHKIRHTACTLMLKRGMDLHTVSRIMGHTDLATTQSYLSLLPEDLTAKHAAASPFHALQAQLATMAPPPPPPRKRRLRERAA